MIDDQLLDKTFFWYTSLYKKAITFCESVCKTSDSNDVEKWILAYLNDRDIHRFLGVDEDISVLKNSGNYSNFLFQLWGRRCHYFFQQIYYGCKTASYINGDDFKKNDLLLREFKGIISHINSKYVREWNIPGNGNINLANYHVTYLDPVLFSGLFFLHKINELGYSISENQKSAIIQELRREIEKYTSCGVGPIGNGLKDESTLWWALVKLLKEEKEEFQICDLIGYEGAGKILKMLLNRQQPIYPTQKEAIWEGTFEIYSDLRTRLMINKNCVYLYKNFSELNHLNQRILSLITFNLYKVQDRSHKIENHSYFMGLALDSIGNVLTLNQD